MPSRRTATTLHSRPPLQRMLVLHGRLQSGAFPNCRRLSEELEVSSKTVQRDLDFMRDQLALPIAYDAARLGYHYTEPVASFPTMEVSAGEVVALCVAQKALEQYEGTAFRKQLAAALRKLTEGLREKISFSWHELDESISFQNVGTTEADLRTFEAISHAVLEHRELHFQYSKLGAKKYEPRRLHPYHLGCIENQWYAIGRDLDRDQMRTFALPRMREVLATRTRFQRPAHFSAQEHFARSFGVFAGGSKQHRIRVRFDPVAGQLVCERCWHPSQKLRELPNGEVELTLELCSLREVQRWILSWGPRATVLAPPELVAGVREAALATAAQYASP